MSYPADRRRRVRRGQARKRRRALRAERVLFELVYLLTLVREVRHG